jgi:hypothetical protein
VPHYSDYKEIRKDLKESCLCFFTGDILDNLVHSSKP